MDSRRDVEIKHRGAVLQSDGSYLNKWGTISWFNEAGVYHRLDGPACIYTDGDVTWLLNDIKYPFDQWCIKLNKTDEAKMLLRLSYG
jgi:hypothetical protein